MFEGIRFKGTFRSYQQHILERADAYLKDGHIHIVAAPGSGKTILGLELVCRLNERALILSPTTTIRDQWGSRFLEDFTGGERNISYDLKAPSDITSVTYQALWSAMRRKAEDEDDAQFDLLETVRQHNIRVVCLDEAHHLQSEWQRTLETFVASLEDIKVIALTATPPYDASPAEWERYIALCGEIDEEIFVPELVKQGTLCPHQDYIYFNFPTRRETEQFDDYRKRAAEALAALYQSGYVADGYARLLARREDYDYLYSHAEGCIAFLMLSEDSGIKADRRLKRSLALKKPYRITAERLEIGINFLIEELLGEAEGKACQKLFKERDLLERGSVALDLNERLRRTLLSSVGKLNSIGEIVRCESTHMGDKLRLLVLTDYIKKDSLKLIGTQKRFDSVSVVSVYETVRRLGAPVGALSGSLVILPRSCEGLLKGYGAHFSMQDTADENVCIFTFDGDNREKVAFVSRLFEEGHIRVLVGTKSLLGEGWDAPYVNALILASFVGSFVLSNQMRGRAIRTYAGDSRKTANIWHLVTVERPSLAAGTISERLCAAGDEVYHSYDYEMLSRRFECFDAPDYETGVIRNGIGRLGIRPPFDEEGVARIDRDMEERSSRRKELFKVWQDGLQDNAGQLDRVSELPKRDAAVRPFVFVNILTAVLLLGVMQTSLTIAVNSAMRVIAAQQGADFPDVLLIAALSLLALVCFGGLINVIFAKLLIWLSPKRAIEKLSGCVLKTMQELSLIAVDAKLFVAMKDGIFVSVELVNASSHDQEVFHRAIFDLFSPIRNPRYVCMPVFMGIKSCWRALACPEVLGAKKEYAEALARNLRKVTGRMCVIYTRTKEGRRLILNCRRRAYISKNYAMISSSRQISRFE